MKHTIEEKLTWLLELQNIDKQLDEIVKIRGVLPDEVQALENELASIQAQLQQDQEEVASLQQTITAHRVRIQDITKLVHRYKEQQMNVRNNREYDTLTKEIELQELDSQLLEKKIKAGYEQIEKKKSTVAESNAAIENTKQALTHKQQKLESVIKESQEEEKNLYEKRKWCVQKLDKDLLKSYEKIRKNVRNNLPLAVVKKRACSGCSIIACPQVQARVLKKEELVHCEHCGRILADVVDRMIPEEDTIEEQPSIDA